MRLLRHSLLRRAAVAVAAGAIAACGSDSTAPIESGTDAARAAQTFVALADSVARNNGDPNLGAAYQGIAGTLLMGRRLTPIVLTIDGTPATFLAAASSFRTTINDCPPGVYCVVGPHVTYLRNLIAFDEKNPRRIVQLSSTDDAEQIGAVLDPSPLALYARMASLVYMDGSGGSYVGTGGTQRFVVSPSNTSCPALADTTVTLLRWLPIGTCVLADVNVSFSAKAEPMPFLFRWLPSTTAAVGSHTIAMSAQTVAGTHHELTIDAMAPPPLPPVPIGPSNTLPATLKASVAGDAVTLTFTVKNPSSEPVKVVYPSAQQFDFVAVDSATGTQAWRWSAGKGFTQAFVEETVPAAGTRTFSEVWKPAPKGLYLVHGFLTSTSHRAEAYASVLVP